MTRSAAALAAAAALLGAVACGNRKSTSSSDESPAAGSAAASSVALPIDAASAPAVNVAIGSKAGVKPPAAWWADRPEPALKALGAALEQLDTTAVDEWLRQRELPVPEGEPPVPPPPAAQAAIDALVAWDGSGALAPMPCTVGMGNAIPFRLLVTVKAALEVASGPNDPPAHAALRMSLALRADDNEPMAMALGAAIVEKATEAFVRHGAPAAVPAPFVVADDLPWRVLASNARCTAFIFETFDATSPQGVEIMDALAKLGHKPEQQLAEEARMVNSFWADTLAQAAQVKTRAELRALLERRIEEARAMQPRSFLVPLLGSPYAAKMLLEDDAE